MWFRVSPTVSRLIPWLFSPFFVLLLFHGADAKTKATHKKPTHHAAKDLNPSPESIKMELKTYLGVRYRRGGRDRKGMDCSGFVKTAYRNLFGVDLPHNAARQCSTEVFEKVSREELSTGDLVFFRRNQKSKFVNHVGIYLGKGRFIHASQSKGVIISSLNTQYWKSKFYTTKRLARGAIETAGKGLDGKEISMILFTGEREGLQVTYTEQSRWFFESLTEGDITDFSPFRPERREGLELTYIRDLLGEAWNVELSGFSRDFSPRDLELPGLFLDRRRWSETNETRSGVRVASSVRPLEWLSITPSLELVDKGQGIDADLSDQTIGLQVDMSTLDLDWLLSTRLLYSEKKDPFSSPGQESHNDSYLDLALMIQHRLTETAQISFMGRQVYRMLPGEEESYPARANREQFFSLSFNFDY